MWHWLPWKKLWQWHLSSDQQTQHDSGTCICYLDDAMLLHIFAQLASQGAQRVRINMQIHMVPSLEHQQVRVCRLVSRRWRRVATDLLLSDTAASKYAGQCCCVFCHIVHTGHCPLHCLRQAALQLLTTQTLACNKWTVQQELILLKARDGHADGGKHKPKPRRDTNAAEGCNTYDLFVACLHCTTALPVYQP